MPAMVSPVMRVVMVVVMIPMMIAVIVMVSHVVVGTARECHQGNDQRRKPSHPQLLDK